jgi:hypothetical protein
VTAAEPVLAPYPGLRPYEPDEAHLFFGRDQQVLELLRRLRVNRFLAVVGTSGCGKSSLVRAGLMPALFGGFMAGGGSSWRIAVMKPGSEPVKNLAEALCTGDVLGEDSPGIVEDGIAPAMFAETTLRRGPLGLVELVRHTRLPAGESLLVVVDQFEEVFRFRSSGAGREDDAAALVKLLLEASRQQELSIFVILTMRSDFLGECPRFRGLPEAINDGQYLVPRLNRDQIRDAITGPANVGGAEVAPRIVQRLLGEAGEDPDQLPQLQHALMRTWDRWRQCGASGPLDVEHYEWTGGIANALSLHADEAHSQLSGDHARAIARKLFQRLTEKSERYSDVRRPGSLGEICAVAEAPEPEVREVIETFREGSRSFLMPPASVALRDETVLDISHESLIRVWGRLRAWVDEESRAAVQWQRLAQSAEWYERGDASLLVEPELSRTLEWWESWKPNEAWAKRYGGGFERVKSFLAESRREDEARQAEELERQQREAEDQSRRAHLEEVRRVVSYFQTAQPEEVAAVRELLSRMADPEHDGLALASFGHAPAINEAMYEKLAATPPPCFTAEGLSLQLANPGLLLEAWPATSKWLEEDRPLMRFRRELGVLMDAWTGAAKNPDHLLTGPLFHRAVRMSERHRGRLNAAEVEFVESSRKGAVRPRTWMVAGCTVAALCLLHIVLMIRSASLNPEFGGAGSTPAGLDVLRQRIFEAHAFAQEGVPFSRRWDRYPWATAVRSTERQYLEEFRSLWYEPARDALLSALRSLPDIPGPVDDYSTPYSNLKAYLMLTEHPRYASGQQEFLKQVLMRVWNDIVPAPPEVRAPAEQHFATFASIYSKHPYGEPADREVVQHARAYLNSFSLVDRAYYSTLILGSGPPLRFAELSPGSQRFLSVPYEIPSPFVGGKAGWQDSIDMLKLAPEIVQREEWVIGTGGRISAEELNAPLRARFINDCVHHWRRLLGTAQLQPFDSLPDAVTKLRELSRGSQSPLGRFLDVVQYNTDLYSPTVADAFQPLRVPRETYFQALAALAQAAERAAAGRTAGSMTASAQAVLTEARKLSTQISPKSDPQVRKALITLLEQPALQALRLEAR